MSETKKHLLDLRFRVTDLDEKKYSEIELYFALNRAKELAQAMLLEKAPIWLRKAVTFSTVLGQQAYTLSGIASDFFRGEAVSVPYENTDTPLTSLSRYSFVDYSEMGASFTGPVAWILDTSLYLGSIPSYTGTNNATLVYLRKIPDAYAQVTDWDLPPCLDSWIAMEAEILIKEVHGIPVTQKQYEKTREYLEAAIASSRRSKNVTGIKMSPIALRMGQGDY